MSIATLKKKTQAKYNNSSVGSNQGFSLNGTLRNQGYVGQTSLSRSLPRTLMKGDVLKGHGGCCGQYYISPIVQSAVTSTNDPTVVKTSAINTNGMIQTKYRGYMKNFTVKPDSNQNLNSQQAYITNLANITNNASTNPTSVCKHVDKTDSTIPTKCANVEGYRKKINTCSYTKPESDYVAMSSSSHLTNKVNKCKENDVFKFPTNCNRTPFP